MENLADELQAIANAPEADLLEQLRVAGERLVDALRDQFVDGQAEALYSLQTASARLRTHVAGATEAAQQVVDLVGQHREDLLSSLAQHRSDLDATIVRSGTQLEALAQDLTASATRQVTEALDRILSEVRASIGEQLAAEVDAGSVELRGAARDHAEAVAAQLAQTKDDLTALYEVTAERAEHARDGLEWVARRGSEQLTTAASSLEQTRIAGEEALTAAGAALSAQVRAAAEEARQQLGALTDDSLRQLREGADEVLATVRAAQQELQAQLVDARRAAGEELEALRQQIAAAERREASVTARLQDQLEAYVSKTDATVGTALRHLQAVADVLADRDSRLEAQRTDEFARVLETLLKEGGVSTRKLRERILRGRETTRDRAPAPSAPVAPPLPPAPPVAAQSSAPKPAGEAPRAPRPAKKTAPRKRTSAPAPTTPPQEDQA